MHQLSACNDRHTMGMSSNSNNIKNHITVSTDVKMEHFMTFKSSIFILFYTPEGIGRWVLNQNLTSRKCLAYNPAKTQTQLK